MEYWRSIPSFPGYSVSDTGLVRNDLRDTFLSLMVNQQGLSYVGLSQGGRQQNRLVSKLVAEAFMVPHAFKAFDTLINKDGDRTNNHINNLIWRPRWFAMKYHRQFRQDWYNTNPVEEVETEVLFSGVMPAAVEFGLLALDVFTEAMNFTYYGVQDAGVWPTGQRFRMIDVRKRKVHIIPHQSHGV